jgi:hypothetical protein
VLPDRLLTLHPGRRGEADQRARISVAEHLELTALVLERWGWGAERPAHPHGRRPPLHPRCATRPVRSRLWHRGHRRRGRAHLNATLRARGIREPYPAWNELPHVTRRQALALVREAGAAARS